MRQPLDLPSYLIRDAELYAPGRKGSDAVEWILSHYPVLLADLRDARRRLAGQEQEGAELDALVDRLRAIAAQIAEL
ncbi:DASH complex subunit Dad3 [Ectopseudomonas hydrolytica]|uniref:DASH complex subunit Dad3 n=1 Tax=Ectopseudomonas hydrolytica TaxID=2493633 RepID=UPI003C2B4E43